MSTTATGSGHCMKSLVWKWEAGVEPCAKSRLRSPRPSISLPTTATSTPGRTGYRARRRNCPWAHHTVTALVTDTRYSADIGRRLHLLAAGLSPAIAWHRFDQVEHAVAGRFWHTGLHSAHADPDHDLGADIRSDLACARPVIDLVPVRSAGVESKWLVRPRHVAELTAAA
ncbi:hypothetical protein [Embleya sp. NBC_00896]|uniref:hypothetical protein n=1 Tax=Embleya sp. NBC_00896 TaxID=2975961 RepID=UPI002F907EC3|nr:hypothetical protein OG928_34405 [Embleya sp. NBC_00896]